jgi:type IV pilus assembly protein PilV
MRDPAQEGARGGWPQFQRCTPWFAVAVSCGSHRVNKADRAMAGRRQTQRGVSIIEVLVTLLTVSLALLGTVGLQAYSLRLNQGALFRIQAVLLAADLGERLQANQAGAVAGWYLQPADSTRNCAAQPCSPADLAAYDLAQWQAAVSAALPHATAQVTRAEAGDPGAYTIRIGWTDRRNNDADSAIGAGGGFFGTGQRFVYTASRVVSDR